MKSFGDGCSCSGTDGMKRERGRGEGAGGVSIYAICLGMISILSARQTAQHALAS